MLILVPSVPEAGFSWGFEAHRMISDRAVQSLPTAIQPFYDRHEDSLSQLSVYPDRRRFQKDDEAPRHYVDLERLPGDTIPETRAGAIDHYGWETLNHAGYVPWRVQHVYDGLVNAFRERDYPRVLFLSGTLSHYLADAHVPLHTTENYDGQLTGDTGVHARFESDLIEQFPNVIKDDFRAAEYVESVPSRTISVVREAHEMVPRVLQGDRENRYDNSDDGWSLVRARDTHGALASERLNAAAISAASFWFSAWVDAGRPELPRGDFSKAVQSFDRRRSTGTWYEGRWVAEPDRLIRDQHRRLKQLTRHFRHRWNVRLARVELTKRPGEFASVSVEIIESVHPVPDDAEAQLKRWFHPLKVTIYATN